MPVSAERGGSKGAGKSRSFHATTGFVEMLLERMPLKFDLRAPRAGIALQLA